MNEKELELEFVQELIENAEDDLAKLKDIEAAIKYGKRLDETQKYFLRNINRS